MEDISWASNLSFDLYEFVPDVDSYLSCIGYDGNREPTLQTLQELIEKHLQVFPFENMNSGALKKVVPLIPELIQQKFLQQHRGGYCFEHHIFSYYLLKALGYKVVPVLARVMLCEPHIDFGDSHLILHVLVDNDWYVFDVGFGGTNSTFPLKLGIEGEEQVSIDGKEKRRVIELPISESFIRPRYCHQLLMGDQWSNMYSFTREECRPMDCYFGNWYICTNPTSIFVSGLLLSRSHNDLKYNLNNRQFSIRNRDLETDKREIITEEELREVLEKYFRLSFPDQPFYLHKDFWTRDDK